MRASSRPELFFIYGIVISVLVIVMFFSKIEQLSSMDDIIADYYANEFALIVDVSASRSGYLRIPFTIARLNDTNVTLSDHQLNLSYVSGRYQAGFSEIRRVLPRVTGSLRNDTGAFVASDHEVSVKGIEECVGEARHNLTIGYPLESDFVTIIVSDPSHGCVEFERIVAARSSDPDGFPSVQRVVVERSLDAEVVIFAR